MTSSTAKLTKAQARMLRSVADGEVLMHFDVYAGYWWTERGKKLPAYGKSEHWPALPLRYLLADGLVMRGDIRRPVSGAQEATYELTPAGRTALSESKE